MKEERFQFVLSESECGFYRHIRELEEEYPIECPMVFSSKHARLNKAVKLNFEIEGHKAMSFDISGSKLLFGCASSSVKFVQTILNSKEDDIEGEEPIAAVDVSTTQESETFSAEGASHTTDADGTDLTSLFIAARSRAWSVDKQELVPSCVEVVSFHVAQHTLSPEQHEDLRIRFPDVILVSDPEETKRQFSADQALRQNFTPEITLNVSLPTPTASTAFDTYYTTVAEVMPTMLTPTAPSPSSVVSTDTNPSSISFKSLNKSVILRIAGRIGLDLSGSVDEILDIWSQWQHQDEVRPFSAVRGHVIEQFYDNLVKLYILAHRNEERDLCFAILLRFQSTNYQYRNKLPNLATAVLAFQYLPEKSGLCCWIARLFAFLWTTHQYESREQLLSSFPSVDEHAFGIFSYVTLDVRDKFTKGHNTAVLDGWCGMHEHKTGDAEAAMCDKARSKLKSQFAKIRKQENEDAYNEAKEVVVSYEKDAQPQSCSVEAPTKDTKRKADKSSVQANSPNKRPRGRGSARRGSS
ncbi:hypothetical protein C7974DRAFT_473247 [Boeremia exigua]|uniref:uncharacterized protein n=1 Tax=Boeremia exigua TaxID=749465 RepID=UPI001E8EBA66|nr:uncharacterized protein C7974DRAFT_473247 [Boeremia exigua]KAH6621780.1 hypothetical protein C7974DRAFT_473247 [Boeremia exigua]